MEPDFPREMLSHILSFSQNDEDKFVCKDWYCDIKYHEKKALSNPDKYINELHPYIRYLLPNLFYRRKIMRLILKTGRIDILEQYRNYFTKKYFLWFAFGIACIYNHSELISFFINKGANNKNLGMAAAALGGHKLLVKYFISLGAFDWEKGIMYAAQGGHNELIKFFVSKIPEEDRHFDWALIDAAKGGHKDTIELLIEYGANDWNNGLYGAAEGGHDDLVNYFIEKGATDFVLAMRSAAKGGHNHLINFFISKGVVNWSISLCGTAEGGHIELAQFFIEKGVIDLILGLRSAAEEGYNNSIKFLISKSITNWNYAKNEYSKLLDFYMREGSPELISMMRSIKYGNLINFLISEEHGWYMEFIDYFIEKGADKLIYAMRLAAKEGYKNSPDFFISKGVDFWDVNSLSIIECCHIELLQSFIERGSGYIFTALNYAAENGHKDILDYLITNYYIHNLDEPLGYAFKNGHEDIVEYLTNKGGKLPEYYSYCPECVNLLDYFY